MIEIIILGVVSIFFGILLLIAFWLGVKAGLKQLPELPQSKINIDDITTSEEQDYMLSDDDYLKQVRQFKDELITKEPEEPEVIEP